ncbi:phosphoribosyltransferase family protein [Nesterenkonia sp. HG001]|uniref:phosphoribosyltransferase family protein n=1 Tax=Nesterenkonia sp. HG001 TaxID=2983207 RepID=UPI002AC54C3F|nr:phosphoribosyltransferase family protein [Nesterenkonia sp. HG001]MDZ5077703.1 phosphoribosyltransferase family protein [Nesterenkonia sp. HG001]
MLADATTAHANVLHHFRWVQGDADTWNMLRDASSLDSIVSELARLSATDKPDVTAGIEARGLVLAPMVALTLGIGFTPIRKGGALFPGDTATVESSPDYRGRAQTLSIRTDHLGPGVRVSLVDDWVETGSQAAAAKKLIEDSDAELVNVTAIIDEADEAARSMLPVIRSIVRSHDLP